MFDSAKKESGWGDLSAASVGRWLGNAANLLPLSFSPLSYFGTGKAPQSGVVGRKGERWMRGRRDCLILTVFPARRREGEGGMWTRRRSGEGG